METTAFKQKAKQINRKELGSYLHFYRLRAGYTASDMAKLLGYRNQQSIYNIESGRNTIQPDRMISFLGICNVNLDDAFKEDYEEIRDSAIIRGKDKDALRVRRLEKIYYALNEDGRKALLSMADWMMSMHQETHASERKADQPRRSRNIETATMDDLDESGVATDGHEDV